MQRQGQLLELIGSKQAAFRSTFGFDDWRGSCQVAPPTACVLTASPHTRVPPGARKGGGLAVVPLIAAAGGRRVA